jgi:hypothetical protein
MTEVRARTLVPGHARGDVLVLDEPLSFWGGFDAATGRVTDRHHPQHGLTLSGRVLLMPAGRGSSSSSSVLAEAIRLGTAPAGIILTEPDGIVALGAIVAAELYGNQCPIVIVPADRYAILTQTQSLTIAASDDAAAISTTR